MCMSTVWGSPLWINIRDFVDIVAYLLMLRNETIAYRCFNSYQGHYRLGWSVVSKAILYFDDTDDILEFDIVLSKPDLIMISVAW